MNTRSGPRGRTAAVAGTAVSVVAAAVATATAALTITPRMTSALPAVPEPHSEAAAPSSMGPSAAAAAPDPDAQRPALSGEPYLGRPTSGPTEPTEASAVTVAGDAERDRVTGLSRTIDALDVGIPVGGPTAISLVQSAVLLAASSALTDVPGGSDLLTALADGFASANEGAVGFGEQWATISPRLREVIAPMAAGNEYGNLVIRQLADGFDAIADQYGDQIQPFDRTLRAEAEILRGFLEEPPG